MGTCEDTKSMRQGSASSPLLFIALVELISRKIAMRGKNILRMAKLIWMTRSLNKETVLSTWVERYVGLANRTRKFTEGLQQGQTLGGKSKR